MLFLEVLNYSYRRQRPQKLLNWPKMASLFPSLFASLYQHLVIFRKNFVILTSLFGPGTVLEIDRLDPVYN